VEAQYQIVIGDLTFSRFLAYHPHFSVVDAAFAAAARKRNASAELCEDEREIMRALPAMDAAGQGLVRAFDADVDPLTKARLISGALGDCVAVFRGYCKGECGADQLTALRSRLFPYLKIGNVASNYAFVFDFLGGPTDASPLATAHDVSALLAMIAEYWVFLNADLGFEPWTLRKSRQFTGRQIAAAGGEWVPIILQGLTRLPAPPGGDVHIIVSLEESCHILEARADLGVGRPEMVDVALFCVYERNLERSKWGRPEREAVNFFARFPNRRVQIVVGWPEALAVLQAGMGAEAKKTAFVEFEGERAVRQLGEKIMEAARNGLSK
jgi:hypothetical protein